MKNKKSLDPHKHVRSMLLKLLDPLSLYMCVLINCNESTNRKCNIGPLSQQGSTDANTKSTMHSLKVQENKVNL